METYQFVMSKDLVSEQEEIKFSNIIKWYKILTMLQKKTYKSTIQVGHKFLIIYT